MANKKFNSWIKNICMGDVYKRQLPECIKRLALVVYLALFAVEPGTYHIYVVAKMNKVLSGKTIQTENNLKNIVLNYGCLLYTSIYLAWLSSQL